MATTPAPKSVLLQDKNGKSQKFEAEHAARLLAYPGTEWSEATPKAAAADAAAESSTAKK